MIGWLLSHPGLSMIKEMTPPDSRASSGVAELVLRTCDRASRMRIRRLTDMEAMPTPSLSEVSRSKENCPLLDTFRIHKALNLQFVHAPQERTARAGPPQHQRTDQRSEEEETAWMSIYRELNLVDRPLFCGSSTRDEVSINREPRF